MIKLRKRDVKALRDAMKNVRRHDLYHALHGVGDDPIKALIEDVLKGCLTDNQFKKVVAVFKLATAMDSPWFEDEEK